MKLLFNYNFSFAVVKFTYILSLLTVKITIMHLHSFKQVIIVNTYKTYTRHAISKLWSVVLHKIHYYTDVASTVIVPFLSTYLNTTS